MNRTQRIERAWLRSRAMYQATMRRWRTKECRHRYGEAHHNFFLAIAYAAHVRATRVYESRLNSVRR